MTAPLSGLGVVVVNYGSAALLERNLTRLSRNAPELIVVVVDNFTSTHEQERLTELAHAEGWHPVLLPTNTGFGGGMNAGADRALELGATELLLLNPDAVIEAEDVAVLLTRVRAEPLTMVAPRILTPEGRVWFAGSDLYLEDGRVRSAAKPVPGRREPWLTGACLLLSGALWQRVGGFDHAYFLYWEDVDLSWRVREAGGALAVVSEATAVHDQGGTQHQTGRAKSAIYYYYNVRNRLLFAARRLDDDQVRRWRRSIAPTAWEILLRGGRRQLLAPRRTLLPVLRGLRDGLRLSRARTTR